MAEEKIKQLLLLEDLTASIVEGTAYLSSHREGQESLQGDTLRAYDAVELRFLQLDPKCAQTLFDGMLRRELEGQISSKTLETVRRWRDALLVPLHRELLREIMQTTALTEKTATALIEHFLRMTGCEAGERYALLLHTAIRCGHSLPLTAYRVLLMIFRVAPDCLASNELHPGYIYRETAQRTLEGCPICGGAGEPYHASFCYLMCNFNASFLPAKLWMKCGCCGNLYVYQFPEKYFSSEQPCQLIAPRPEEAIVCGEPPSGLFVWGEILKHSLRLLDGEAGEKIEPARAALLEVGIGTGGLLAVALELGLHPDAVEIDREGAERIANLLGLPIWNGDFLAYQADKKYDIITMGDVIEHVSSPRAALEKAYALLQNNGVLWLSTPNYESSFSRMMKFTDPMWQEPYHLTYFSYAGLKRLAEECGFQVREYAVSNRYNGSMELYLTKCQTENIPARIDTAPEKEPGQGAER